MTNSPLHLLAGCSFFPRSSTPRHWIHPEWRQSSRSCSRLVSVLIVNLHRSQPPNTCDGSIKTCLKWHTRWFFRLHLRTVPTIVIAHTFCASPDTRISYRQCLLTPGYFCAVWNYPEKVDLSKYSWYPKRKLGVTTHFWEIIKLQFEKERHTLLCILKLFTDIIHELSLKNAWLPPIFFLDFNRTC